MKLNEMEAPKLPRFSIVIPAFESTALALRAIASILIQRYQNYEIIISDDSVAEVIRDVVYAIGDPRLEYVANRPGLGAVRNWNAALDRARGEYVILMHHDECFKDGSVLSMIDNYITKDKAEVVISVVETEFSDRATRRSSRFGFMRRLVITHWPDMLYAVNVIGPTATVCFNRRLSAKFDERLSWLVDVEWYVRLLRSAASVRVINSVCIGSFHGHAHQITGYISREVVAKKELQALTSAHGRTLGLALAGAIWSIKGRLRRFRGTRQ
jgi:glycosyltransferase involved in cell wall biosynthesis